MWGALPAAMELPQGDERNQALVEVSFGLALTDSVAAVKMAIGLHLDGPSVVERLVQQWAAMDLSAHLTGTSPIGIRATACRPPALTNSRPVASARCPLIQRIGGNCFYDFTQPANVDGIIYGAEASISLQPVRGEMGRDAQKKTHTTREGVCCPRQPESSGI